MISKLYLLTSCSLLSHFTWAQTADLPEKLPTIVIEAEQTTNNLTKNLVTTKFTHDVIDVPFSRSFVSEEMLKQQDIQRIDDVLNQVSGVFSQTNYGGWL